MATVLHHTVDQFKQIPERDDDQTEELIDGEIIVSPGAKVWHSAIVRRLRLKLAALEQDNYVLASDFSCILGTRSMPIPDLAVISLDRWNAAEKNDGWLEGSPELVIEVSSPSNRGLERKATLYLEHGAEQVWLVYRNTRTVVVVTPQTTSELCMGQSLQFRGVSLLVDSLFPAA